MSADGDRPTGNVLVMAPAMSDGKTEACYELLTGVDPAATDLLRVVSHRSPERLVEEWESQVGTQPANTVIVGVDDRVQSGTLGNDGPRVDEGNLRVLAANPNDLTGLGMELNNALEALSGTDNRPFVCFDSVTALLQFVDVENAYQFSKIMGHFFMRPHPTPHRDEEYCERG